MGAMLSLIPHARAAASVKLWQPGLSWKLFAILFSYNIFVNIFSTCITLGFVLNSVMKKKLLFPEVGDPSGSWSFHPATCGSGWWWQKGQHPWSMLLTLPEKSPGHPKSPTALAGRWDFPLPIWAVVSHLYSTLDQTCQFLKEREICEMYVLCFIYPVHEYTMIFCCKVRHYCKIILQFRKCLGKGVQNGICHPPSPAENTPLQSTNLVNISSLLGSLKYFI